MFVLLLCVVFKICRLLKMIQVCYFACFFCFFLTCVFAATNIRTHTTQTVCVMCFLFSQHGVFARAYSLKLKKLGGNKKILAKIKHNCNNAHIHTHTHIGQTQKTQPKKKIF